MSKKYPFLDRWLTDTDLKSAYVAYIDGFIRQFKNDFHPTLLKMLNHYDFYNSERTSKLFEEFAAKVTRLVATKTGKTCLITLPITDSKVHNSDQLAQVFKNNPIFKWRIEDGDLSICDCLFIVDDYAGSGNTLLHFYEDKKKTLKQGSDVYALPVFATKFAFETLEHSKMICDKTITIIKNAHFYTNHRIISNKEKDRFDIVSKYFCRVGGRYINGEYDTEDLFSLGNSTPNNTFGLFWYDSNTLYRPLFARSRDQTLNIKTKRMSHNIIEVINASIKTNAVTNRMRDTVFVPILMHFGFNDGEIKEMLGLNETNYQRYINYLRRKSIIANDNDVDINELKRYVDLGKILLYIQTGIKQTCSEQSTIEMNLKDLIDKF